MKTLHGVAKVLLDHNISFDYKRNESITVTDVERDNLFHTATLHVDTGRVVFMDINYNEVTMCSILTTLGNKIRK